MSEPSLDFYFNIFRNNPQKISVVKDLLLKDFRMMESKILLAAEEHDLKAIRAELHKMNPIVSNLKFSRMLGLLEKYKNHDRYSADVDQLNEELKECLSDIYKFLERK